MVSRRKTITDIKKEVYRKMFGHKNEEINLRYHTMKTSWFI
jgi:hypothetical protein